jgi:Cu+-exporting ATPase
MDTKRGLVIPVHGLGCGGAGATTIERALLATHGVLRAYVNPATESAYVDFDPAETDAWVVARAIERAGYQAGRPTEA